MIISASRRTDIPAFYSDWFFNRIKEGFVCVRNPMNPHQVSKIKLTSDVMDCIVFWTKNPEAMLKKHKSDLLRLDIPFYFQFSVNPYGKDMESNVPEKKYVFETFAEMSSLFGKEKIIWRYDPIILTDTLTMEYHFKYFEYIARKLAPYTQKCVISFVDVYRKAQKNLEALRSQIISYEQQQELGAKLNQIAKSLGLTLVTCAEEIDLSDIGIAHGSCIDPELISRLCHGHVIAKKDKNQRYECGCIDSIDIGAYNTCLHGCKYCYANYSHAIVQCQNQAHDPTSPLLIGNIEPEDKVTERKVKSVVIKQPRLF